MNGQDWTKLMDQLRLGGVVRIAVPSGVAELKLIIVNCKELVDFVTVEDVVQ